MRTGKQYTYMLRANDLASFDELLKFFKHKPPTNSCSSYSRSDYIFKQRSRAGLVSSSDSSAVEFPTVITDRLREQQGAQVLQRISVQNKLLCSRALPYSTLGVSISRHLVLAESTISACTVEVKRSSIQSDIIPNSDTCRE